MRVYQAILEQWKKQRTVILLVIVAVVGLPIIATQGVAPRSNEVGMSFTATHAPRYSGVTLPDHYRETYVHYANIERPDGTVRDVYINPEAMDSLRLGLGLPNGTTIVIEAYYALKDASGKIEIDANGHYLKGEPFEMIHVRQKRGDWAESDFVSEARSGNWNFGSFDTQTGQPYEESISACFNCHNTSPQTDFLFTSRQLSDYAYYGELQYYLCNLTGRTPCQ